MPLSKKQRTQLKWQLQEHQHKRYEVDFELTEGHALHGFVVHPNVWRPEITSARYLARFLFFNNGIYRGKTVVDMGCGSGVQGIVMGLYGADFVFFSDVSPEAVKNTEENVKRFGLTKKSAVLEGDLFEKIYKTSDVIVFNHPFFPSEPDSSPISKAMLDDGSLIQRFLEEAKIHLKRNGTILMPYLDFSGPTNNPQIQGQKHGYDVEERFSTDIHYGLHKGQISIYELRL